MSEEWSRLPQGHRHKQCRFEDKKFGKGAEDETGGWVDRIMILWMGLVGKWEEEDACPDGRVR